MGRKVRRSLGKGGGGVGGEWVDRWGEGKKKVLEENSDESLRSSGREEMLWAALLTPDNRSGRPGKRSKKLCGVERK